MTTAVQLQRSVAHLCGLSPTDAARFVPYDSQVTTGLQRLAHAVEGVQATIERAQHAFLDELAVVVELMDELGLVDELVDPRQQALTTGTATVANIQLTARRIADQLASFDRTTRTWRMLGRDQRPRFMGRICGPITDGQQPMHIVGASFIRWLPDGYDTVLRVKLQGPRDRFVAAAAGRLVVTVASQRDWEAGRRDKVDRRVAGHFQRRLGPDPGRTLSSWARLLGHPVADGLESAATAHRSAISELRQEVLRVAADRPGALGSLSEHWQGCLGDLIALVDHLDTGGLQVSINRSDTGSGQPVVALDDTEQDKQLGDLGRFHFAGESCDHLRDLSDPPPGFILADLVLRENTPWSDSGPVPVRDVRQILDRIGFGLDLAEERPASSAAAAILDGDPLQVARYDPEEETAQNLALMSAAWLGELGLAVTVEQLDTVDVLIFGDDHRRPPRLGVGVVQASCTFDYPSRFAPEAVVVRPGPDIAIAVLAVGLQRRIDRAR